MQSDDLERTIEQSHFALSGIVRGNSEPFEVLFSQLEDVTLGNPFGPFVRGWQEVAQTAADAASRYRDGSDRRLRAHRTRLRSRSQPWRRRSARLIRAATMSGSHGRMMPSDSSRSRQVRTVRSDRPV
jgi:hypothetical protein